MKPFGTRLRCRHRITVSTTRCGRVNPGSIPGVCNDFDFVDICDEIHFMKSARGGCDFVDLQRDPFYEKHTQWLRHAMRSACMCSSVPIFIGGLQ